MRPGQPPNVSKRDGPLWSVMIPVYNCTKYVSQALDSVLSQGFDDREMQIEVIDNCSTEGNIEDFMKERYANISFYRQPQRVGMAANWNTCIERAKGLLVHILHHDDFVAKGYYAEIATLAEKYPEVGLYATRSYFVDQQSIITGVTDRVHELEQPAKDTEPFFYSTPIQCAGVTVRRSAYEALGGFRLDLGYVTDCEMWARVTGCHGAIVSSNVSAFYRWGDGTETHRLSRTAEVVKNICRLNDIFARRYPSFSTERGRARVSAIAWGQYLKFKSLGDEEAAAANRDMWVRLTPASERIVTQVEVLAKSAFRKLALRGHG